MTAGDGGPIRVPESCLGRLFITAKSDPSKEVEMNRSIMDLVAEAMAVVPRISPADAAAMKDRGDALIVDVREDREVAQTGKIEGAIHASRGMLEFCADEATPFHNSALSRDKTVILYCGSGGRAALCGKALQELGYQDVRNLGGLKDWVEYGGPLEKV